MPSQTETFYAVQLTTPNGRPPRLALGPDAGPHLFYWRQPAVTFKRGLLGCGFKTPRVVKVHVTYRWS